ncbi:phage terminase large subunit [Sinorhizobium meliloti]|uniref:phage terminase large subunit n=1 Tax=Rhizobium meliloti TaxID=382 RepID=UPI0020917BF5|nr:phage terminase large subunit [Sinorhizobium meliloti]MCO5965492.1 phage terminase large subunit [Sinorhizobium meliloti]
MDRGYGKPVQATEVSGPNGGPAEVRTLAAFNPRLTTDFVYRRFVTNTPRDTIKRQINYNENPFLSTTILKVIEAKRKEDEDEYRHIYLGEPLEDDDAVIIKRSWIRAAIGVDPLRQHRRRGIRRRALPGAE